ncbi:MAG: hypothetical protein JST35_07630 [Armatimonadetes bacterium]|nr:hypothetical protein [Armatimonadota bacterium]
MDFFFHEGIREYCNREPVNPRERAITAALGATLVRLVIEEQNYADPTEATAFHSGCIYLCAGRCEGQVEFIWSQVRPEGNMPARERVQLAQTLVFNAEESLAALKFIMPVEVPSDLAEARDRDIINALTPGSGFPISDDDRHELVEHLNKVGYTPTPQVEEALKIALSAWNG